MPTITARAGKDVRAAYVSAVSGDTVLVEDGAVWTTGTFWLDRSGVKLTGVNKPDGTKPDSGTGVLRVGNVTGVEFSNFIRRDKIHNPTTHTAHNVVLSDLEFMGYSGTSAIDLNCDTPGSGLTIRRVKVRSDVASKRAVHVQNWRGGTIEDLMIDNRHPFPRLIASGLSIANCRDFDVRRVRAVNSYNLVDSYYQGDCFTISGSCDNILLEDIFGYGAADSGIDCKGTNVTLRRCSFGGAKRCARIWNGGKIEEWMLLFDARSYGDNPSWVTGLWADGAASLSALTGKELITFINAPGL